MEPTNEHDHGQNHFSLKERALTHTSIQRRYKTSRAGAGTAEG